MVVCTLSVRFGLITLQPYIHMWQRASHLNLQTVARNLHIPLNI